MNNLNEVTAVIVGGNCAPIIQTTGVEKTGQEELNKRSPNNALKKKRRKRTKKTHR